MPRHENFVAFSPVTHLGHQPDTANRLGYGLRNYANWGMRLLSVRSTVTWAAPPRGRDSLFSPVASTTTAVTLSAIMPITGVLI